nr:hypothetical protein [uncultured Draconibacterium sp.]
MNYSNHILRTNLQEWKNRLYRATYAQFGNQLKFLINNLENNSQTSGLLKEANQKHNYSLEELSKISNHHRRGTDIEFESEIHQAAFCNQILKYMISESGNYNLHNLMFFSGRDFDGTKTKIVEDYISPILNYLHDKLDKSNSTIYLLEKYKRRTEWFTKKELFNQYNLAEKNYEQILEDDLRLFLFDQGIDYPFSTPGSASGRADIIGEIETDDPLIIEIKIFDREKGYGKDRIKDGFSQIVKYANDYNKDVGYLVIYNMDEAELNLNFSENNNVFPASIRFNNKIFFFIVINSSCREAASKSGTIKEIEITENELTKK